MLVHEESKSRFLWRESDQEAYLSYYLEPNQVIVFDHTIVPKCLSGRGIGSKLVEAGFAYAQGKKLQVKSTCSFVSSKLARKG